MKQAVAYYRVSTLDQSVEMQRHDIQAYCTNRKVVLAKEYEDNGVSGATSSRPALDELLKDIKRRKVGTVIVWSLSRLGRSLKHLLTIVEEFQSSGATLVSIKEGWDLSTPSGRMIFQVLGALSEWEREQIRERVKGGLRAAKAKGRRLGRPTVNYDPSEILLLRRSGNTYRMIARATGVSRQTIYRILSQNPSKNPSLST